MKYTCLFFLLLTSCSVERIAFATTDSQCVTKEQFNGVMQTVAQRLNALEGTLKSDESKKSN